LGPLSPFRRQSRRCVDPLSGPRAGQLGDCAECHELPTVGREFGALAWSRVRT
jgi:hypothetical protein